MLFQIVEHFEVAAPLQETFAFFSSVEKLPLITPPWLAFTVHTPQPITLQNNTKLDYSIRWLGIPIRWRTLIIEFSPPHQFIDLQVRGPYTLWHHQHTFQASAAGTICYDRIFYRVPGGPLGGVLNALLIRRQLRGILQHRRKAAGEHLGWVRAIVPAPQFRRL